MNEEHVGHEVLGQYKWQDIAVDTERETVSRGRRQLKLTRHEYRLLVLLLEQEGLIVGRSELAALGGGAERTVDSHICRIRRKLGPAARAIWTVRGRGWRFDAAAASIFVR